MKKYAAGIKMLFPGILGVIIILSGCVTPPDITVELPEVHLNPRTQRSSDPLLQELENRTDSASDEDRGPLVSGNYFDTDIRAILMELSTLTGINLIPDQTVQGMLTISFSETALEDVLDMILYQGGWSYIKENTYYLIGSADPNNPAAARLMVSESLMTNSEARLVRAGLPAMYLPYVSIPGQDENRLIINAPSQLLWKIKEAVGQIDKAKKLIAVSVIVAEVSYTEGMAAGLDWGEPILSIESAGSALASTNDVSGLTGSISGDLNLALMAMGKSGTVEIRANPKIVALDGESAVVEIITDQYMPIIDSSDNLASTDVKVISSGISLTVLPRITRDGEIFLKVEPVVSDQRGTSVNGGLPVISTRRTSTTVKLGSNETFILGGLIETRENKQFQNAGYSSDRLIKELIVFLTPEIL